MYADRYDEARIETARLIIRPFGPGDLHAIHAILDRAFGDGGQVDDPQALADRRAWLEWSRLSQEWLPRLHQPPYGDRALVLKATGTVIGAAGLVPCLTVFEQLPQLRTAPEASGFATPEVGLFWAVDEPHRRRGYATEAAQALIDYAFGTLRVKRVIATTEYDNVASQGVMRKLGMELARNPLPDPPYLQVVGILANPGR